MDKVKTFYNFEKIDERGQKKFKKIIAHNVLRIKNRFNVFYMLLAVVRI